MSFRIIQRARLEPVEAGRWQKQAPAPAEPTEPWWSREEETPKSQPIGWRDLFSVLKAALLLHLLAIVMAGVFGLTIQSMLSQLEK